MTAFVSLLVIGLLRFSISSWFTLGRLYASRTFEGRVGGMLGNRTERGPAQAAGCVCGAGRGDGSSRSDCHGKCNCSPRHGPVRDPGPRPQQRGPCPQGTAGVPTPVLWPESRSLSSVLTDEETRPPRGAATLGTLSRACGSSHDGTCLCPSCCLRSRCRHPSCGFWGTPHSHLPQGLCTCACPSFAGYSCHPSTHRRMGTALGPVSPLVTQGAGGLACGEGTGE